MNRLERGRRITNLFRERKFYIEHDPVRKIAKAQTAVGVIEKTFRNSGAELPDGVIYRLSKATSRNQVSTLLRQITPVRVISDAIKSGRI